MTGRAPRQGGGDDRGWVTAFVAVIAVAMILVAGLVIDGGRTITTRIRAHDLAANAARAAAQAADPATLYDAEAPIEVRQPDAQAAAAEFLGRADPGVILDEVEVIDGDQVAVTVSLTRSMLILPGGDVSVTATATATAVREVDNDPTETGGP